MRGEPRLGGLVVSILAVTFAGCSSTCGSDEHDFDAEIAALEAEAERADREQAIAVANAPADPAGAQIHSVIDAIGYALLDPGAAVWIEGWLGTCVELSCAIFPSPNSEAEFGFGSGVSVGVNDDIEPQLQALTGKRVRMLATLDPTCLSGCFDRGAVFQPHKIVEVAEKSE